MQTIQTAEQQDESFQGRLIAWRTYWGAGTSRPLTGAGMYAMNATSNFLHYMPYDAGLDQAKAAHSIYFQLAGELGLVALTTFLGIAALSWIAATHQMKQSQDHHNSEWFYSISSAYQSSLAAYLVGGAALSLAYYDLFYILIALSVSLSRNTILHPGRSPIAASLPSRPLALRDTKQTFYPTPSANSIRR
jgi:O-antigen ligase